MRQPAAGNAGRLEGEVDATATAGHHGGIHSEVKEAVAVIERHVAVHDS